MVRSVARDVLSLRDDEEQADDRDRRQRDGVGGMAREQRLSAEDRADHGTGYPQ
jgi:hypothetical protein